MNGFGTGAVQGASSGAAIGTMIAPGIGTAIGAVGGGLLGGSLNYFAEREKAKNVRPQYVIPEDVMQNLTQAQQMAMEGLPDEQKRQFLSNIQRSGAFALNQIGDRRGGLVGLAALNENMNQSYANMLAQDSAARINNQQALMGQRQNVADYKDQAFQFNKVNPYYEKVAENNASQAAMMNNINNAGQVAAYGLMGQQGNGGDKMGLYGRIPQGTTRGLDSNGNMVSAMPNVNPANANFGQYMPYVPPPTFTTQNLSGIGAGQKGLIY